MSAQTLDSLERPVTVVLCGKSLCSRLLAEHLRQIAEARGLPLEAVLDACDDSPSLKLADVDIVFTCASECSGHDDPTVYARSQERYPDARIIAMSPRAHAWNLVSALDSGAKGFIACGVDGITDVVAALRGVLEGDIAFSNEVSRLIVTTLRCTTLGHRESASATRLGEQLTTREHGVLALLCDGLSNQQIASALGVSPNTVKNHLTRIYRKLDAGSRTEAIGIAMRSNLL